MKTPQQVCARIVNINDWLRDQKDLHANAHKSEGSHARQIREQSGLGLRAVAAEMQITYPFLADLELGKRTWTTPTAKSWLEAMEKLDPALRSTRENKKP